jgi:hypothetical protein
MLNFLHGDASGSVSRMLLSLQETKNCIRQKPLAYTELCYWLCMSN